MDSDLSADEGEQDEPMEIDDVYCVCGDFVSSNEESLFQHQSTKAHRLNFIRHPERVFKYSVRLGASAFKNNICEYIVSLTESSAQSYEEVLEQCRETMKQLYNFEQHNNGTMRAQIRVIAVHENPVNLCQLPEDVEPEPYNFIDTREIQPKYLDCFPTTEFEEFYENQKTSIVQKAEELEQRGSGWSFESFSHMILSITQYDAIRGSCFIPTPKDIRTRRATLNIQNKDNRYVSHCIFFYCLC